MNMPDVSIVMPTYNRLATIRRAIGSVLAQSFTEWELIVVDDGSTDGTDTALSYQDDRIRIVRTPNRGAAAARNVGVSLSRGRYITFLDSDDEWLPHFLAIGCGFLDRHPSEYFVATEFLERDAHGNTRLQDRTGIAELFVPLARRVGSDSLALAQGANDDYLRIYQTCEPLGAWWRSAVGDQFVPAEAPRRYLGHIGEHYRWGHLHALWCIVFRREAVLGVGPFDEHRRSCNDLKFLVGICRRHRANMLTIPSVVKHEIDVGMVSAMVAPHLASGPGHFTFLKNQVAVFEELFLGPGRERDGEARSIFGFMCFRTARAALGRRDEGAARHYLALAATHLADNPRLKMLAWISRWMPSGFLGYALSGAWRRLELARARIAE
jgi:Glycosyl transferase family 2